jgi:hypothetical protein
MACSSAQPTNESRGGCTRLAEQSGETDVATQKLGLLGVQDWNADFEFRNRIMLPTQVGTCFLQLFSQMLAWARHSRIFFSFLQILQKRREKLFVKKQRRGQLQWRDRTFLVFARLFRMIDGAPAKKAANSAPVF